MSGQAYDRVLAQISEMKLEVNENQVAYCVAGLHFAYKFYKEDKIKFAEEIKDLRRRIDKDIIDEKTIELAEIMIDFIYDAMELQLQEEKDEYCSYVEKQISKFQKFETVLGSLHFTLQLTVVLGAVSLPFILNNPDLKIVSTIISISVALAAGISTFFKIRDHIIYFKQIKEKMQHEYNLFLSSRKHYSGLKTGSALDLLMDKIDDIQQEQNEQVLKLEKAAQERDKLLEDMTQMLKNSGLSTQEGLERQS